MDPEGKPLFSCTPKRPFAGLAFLLAAAMAIWIAVPALLRLNDNSGALSSANRQYMRFENRALSVAIGILPGIGAPMPAEPSEAHPNGKTPTNVKDLSGGPFVPMGSAKRMRSFTDVPQAHWAFQYIMELTARFIVDGYPEDDGSYTFKPDNNITRAEYIKLLTALLDMPPEPDFDGSLFSDWADTENWARPYIGAAVKSGLVQGSFDDDLLYINSNDNISRQEMIVMAIRAHSKGANNAGVANGIENAPDPEAAKNKAPDYLEAEDWAQPSLIYAINNDMVDIPNRLVRPLFSATRAETALTLSKLLPDIIN
jgi:hypothetical protein